MKNIKLFNIVLATLLTIQVGAFAIQPKKIEMQNNINVTKRQILGTQKNKYDKINKQIDEITNRYYNNFRTCVPFHYNQNVDIFGLKINFQIDINGWKENKCEYYFTGNIESLGKDLKEVFYIPLNDEKLAKIKPIIQCGFTQEQLNLIVDVITEKNQRNSEYIQQLLANPNEKYINNTYKKLTPKEEKLITMIFDDKACSIPNFEEVMNNISELLVMPIEQSTPESNK